MKKDENFDELEYPDDKGNLQRIPKGNTNLLKSFKQFIAHKSNQGVTFNNNDDWKAITCSDFNSFKVSHAQSVIPIVPNPAPASSSTVQQPPPVDIVHKFKHGIKCDITNFLHSRMILGGTNGIEAQMLKPEHRTLHKSLIRLISLPAKMRLNSFKESKSLCMPYLKRHYLQIKARP